MSDATQRSVRTLIQGAVVVVLITVIPIVLSAIQGGVDKVDWTATGYAALTAALTAVGSFVMAKLSPPA